MDIKQLRYFIKIVECGNVTRAAEALHIVQPALSQQLGHLESELGTRLLNRSALGVKATRSGELLYRHGREILRQVDNTRAALRQESSRPTGRVSVAMPSSIVRTITAPLLLDMRDRYPGITLELVESPSAELPEQVAQGRVEIAIVTIDGPVRGLALQPLIKEDLFVLMPPNLKILRESITLRELAKLPIILPSPPNFIRTRIDLALSQAGFNYEVVAEASTTSLLISAVKSGLGVTVLPLSTINEEAADTIYAKRITRPSLSRQLAICTTAVLPISVAGEKVRDVIADVVRKLVRAKVWKGAKDIADA